MRRLLDAFGTLRKAWEASPRELAGAGLDSRTVETLAAARVDVDPQREFERVEQAGATVLLLDHPGYPRLLQSITYPPPVLYVQGELTAADGLAVAVVGTRVATSYGRQVVERIVPELARNGVTVVSGLARGIDSHAHRAALDAGGRTVAVLGCGVDVAYPPENAKLARAIAQQGAVVSEFPLGMPPDAANFPARNRIISGLSLATLVVEAGEVSGALITAEFAVDQGRDVLAVPGSIFSARSRGAHALIQKGAKLVMDAQDVLEELNLSAVPQQLEIQGLIPQDPTEAAITALISGTPMHIDAIRREIGLPIATVSSTLAVMELKGLVRQVGGMSYVAR